MASAGPALEDRLQSFLQLCVRRRKAPGGISADNESHTCREQDVAFMDHFSPVAPAHIRVLVLPVGQIESTRFTLLVKRLQQEGSIVPLKDVESRGDGSDILLSPTAFPQGSLLYRYSATAPPEHHEKISPYEFFREPLVVLGVVDGLHNDDHAGEEELKHAAVYLRERHPRVVHRQLIALRYNDCAEVSSSSNEIYISLASEEKNASLRAAVKEISARFLVEFATYAKAVQASPTIQTPGQTAKGLKRESSLREGDKRPSSGHGDSSHASSPTEGGRNSDAISRPPSMPATSFDQIPSANASDKFQRQESEVSAQSNKSKSRARSSSQDRVLTQGFGNLHGERFVATGFGQSSSQEKTRASGKARVGIVMGSIYMMSGQWSEALRLLAESTTISHALTDHLWHAKGLENMLVCMMLLFWSNTEFKVPKICDLAWDRVSASKFSRVTSNPPGAPRESAESAKDMSQGHRLSVVVPGLAKKILTLLRFAEGSLELPFLVFAEASVRIAKLLAALNVANGELAYEKLQAFVGVAGKAFDTYEASGAGSFIDIMKPHSKAGIAEVLTQALPLGGDILAISDHVRLLAGIASVYSMIGFDRKRAMTVKDAVTRLTGALMHARKLGAAEMGIHPAASLSTGANLDNVLSIVAEGSGLASLMAGISNIYGLSLSFSRKDSPVFGNSGAFGNSSIKFEVLRALAGFCEAAPDPQGVVLMTASLLRAAGPNAAIDVNHEPVMNAFSREEQMHLATVISRTVAVSKNLGLADVQAVYWDSFLVRGVQVLQPAGDKAIIASTPIHGGIQAVSDHPEPGNPLLYDPNASRPGTAKKPMPYLVQDEPTECLVNLQNPFDIPIDIEELSLVTDGLSLISKHEPTTLGPLRFQQISLMVHATTTGPTTITGCLVKMQGCVPQVFPVVTKAWSAKASNTTKQIGLDARPLYNDKPATYDLKHLGIESVQVPVVVLPSMPTLMVECNEEVIMLLEGETRPLTLRLRNTSMVAASVCEIGDSAGLMGDTRLGVSGPSSPSARDPSAKAEEILVPAGAVVSLPWSIYGKASTAMTEISCRYRASGRPSKHARTTSIQIKMTVVAVLQVQNMEILHSSAIQAGFVEVFMDIRNAWSRTVSYRCNATGVGPGPGSIPVSQGHLAPGEVRRISQKLMVTHAASEHIRDVEIARQRFMDNFWLSWSVDARSGIAELRGLPLSQESLRVLRGAPIDLSVAVNDRDDGDDGSSVPVAIGSFVQIRVDVSNRGKRSALLNLRLSDKQISSSRTAPQRYNVVGMDKRLLSPLDVAKMRFITFVICPLVAGPLHLEVLLEPVNMSLSPATDRWCNTVPVSLDVYDKHEN